jgi:two-component system, OmpR family, sensor kinase
VNFNSTTRLRLVTIVVTTLLTVGIGGYASVHTYQSDQAKVDSRISETIQAAIENPGRELSASLFFLDQYSLDLSLFLLSRDDQLTTINESTELAFKDFSIKAIEASKGQVSGGLKGEDFHFQALEIAEGDYLIVAGSIEAAAQALRANLVAVAGFSAIANFFAFILLSFFIRKIKRRDDVDALARMQEFLGDASHELRTPLTVIKGYVEMLSKRQISDPEMQARAFDRVNSEIGRMEGLIHDLLLLAELGESAVRNQEVVDLSAIVRAHSDDFATLHPARTVEVEILDDLQVLALKEYLARFIQNALGNIARHTPADAPVRITVARIGRSIHMAIEDGGPGLPKGAYRDKLRTLNRFDKSRSRENGGSGLGLSIMAAVVEKIGGEFYLRPSELGGLAVIVTLPLISNSNK